MDQAQKLPCGLHSALADQARDLRIERREGDQVDQPKKAQEHPAQSRHEGIIVW